MNRRHAAGPRTVNGSEPNEFRNMRTTNKIFRLDARGVRWLAAMTGVFVLLGTAISCRTVNRAVVQLPDVPGAKYIGSKECDQCHEELYRDFQTADHARLMTEGPNAIEAGCESCHGPASR